MPFCTVSVHRKPQGPTCAALLQSFDTPVATPCPPYPMLSHPPPPPPSCLYVQPNLLGVIPVIEGQFTSLQKDAVWWPPRLRQAAAICNSLTFVRKNKVVGDMAELKLCQAVEAHFVVSLLPSLPSKCYRDILICDYSHSFTTQLSVFSPSSFGESAPEVLTNMGHGTKLSLQSQNTSILCVYASDMCRTGMRSVCPCTTS